MGERVRQEVESSRVRPEPMSSRQRRPSLTSLIALVFVVAPLVYVLSYAPVVRVYRRSVEAQRLVPRVTVIRETESGWVAESPREGVNIECADSSVYPGYQPLDWLIDNTALRELMFKWADLWRVRGDFEAGYQYRHGGLDDEVHSRILTEPPDFAPREPMYVL